MAATAYAAPLKQIEAASARADLRKDCSQARMASSPVTINGSAVEVQKPKDKCIMR